MCYRMGHCVARRYVWCMRYSFCAQKIVEFFFIRVVSFAELFGTANDALQRFDTQLGILVDEGFDVDTFIVVEATIQCRMIGARTLLCGFLFQRGSKKRRDEQDNKQEPFNAPLLL